MMQLVRPALVLSGAALFLAGCSGLPVRLATPSEISQATASSPAAAAPGAPGAPGGPASPGQGPGPVSPSPSVSATPAAPSPSASPGGGAANSAALSQFQETLRNIASAMAASVVQINTGQGLGSGVLIDATGDIVTNAHIVAGASSFTVKTSDGHQFPASLVGTYAQNDLAVVKATAATGLKPAAFGDSSRVHVGDIVLAVGSPFGLTDTVTEGIVSATGRAQSEGNGVTLTDLVQTTAPINPGNSGGALVNIDGQVIGMPTLGGADSQGQGQPAVGIGFAIPSNQVVDYSKQLVAGGKVTHTNRAYLGIATRDDQAGGAVVTSVVAGGPAGQAGIQAGWALTAVGGHDVADSNGLSQVLSGLHPGNKVPVSVRLPDGSNRTITVALGERPTTP